MRELLSEIDHLVYVVSDLQQGMKHMEDLFGVAPSPGGHHPDFGTHNALLGLGPETYLEIIAIDPSLSRPAQSWPFGLSEKQKSKLQTWAVKSVLSRASLVPPVFGVVSQGSRQTRSGKLLSWKLTDPWLMGYDGLIPFLIDWGQTEHPATDLPQVGSIEGIQMKHSRAEEVRSSLEVLDIDADFVQASERVEMRALIRQTDGKLITLQ